jgi:membrane-associated phospholipid phosphatase
MNQKYASIHQLTTVRFQEGSDEQDKSRSIRDVPGDIFNAGKIFVYDFVHVSSEPARWERGDWMWFSGFAATTALLFAFDQEIYDAIHRNRNVFGIRFLVELGDFFEPVGHMAIQNKYFIASLGVGYILNYRPLTVLSGEILETFIIGGLYSEGAKILVGRKRPNQGEGPYSFSFNGGKSFPSGHARNIFQFATILSHHFRWLPFQIFTYTVATGVSIQRITSESHWPSDVFFGAVFGAWVTQTILDYHQVKGITLKPSISPENAYMGVAVRLVLR